jgi:hypothetical protein
VKLLRKAGKLNTLHRRELPPEPKTHRDLKTHIFEAEFKEAEKSHLKGHEESRTWEAVRKCMAYGK